MLPKFGLEVSFVLLAFLHQVSASFEYLFDSRLSKQVPLNLNKSNVVRGPELQNIVGSPGNTNYDVLVFTQEVQKSKNVNLDFDTWLAWQSNQSFHFILENIGGFLNILNESEVTYGVVIASQLRTNPNYFFNWIRDSALTIRTLIHQLNDVHDHSSLSIKSIIELYIEVNFHLQRQPNKSGKFDDERRSGLGEPKFMPNGLSFNEAWGRPQSDGPALRILTIKHYISYLERLDDSIKNPVLGNVSNIYHNIIKPDLEYVMANWQFELFDLWEEIHSHHFFNCLVQLKSLQDGLDLARNFDHSAKFLIDLEDHFNKLKNFILNYDTGFQSYKVPYIIETPFLFHQRKRSGLDAATLLASLHSHNTDLGNDINIPFDIDDSHILNTISSMVTDMKFRYPINHKYLGKPQSLGVGLGRYPEDIYDGYATTEGNPWFICTASAAEILYKLVYKRIKEKSDIKILLETREFYSFFVNGFLEEIAHSDDNFAIDYGSDRYIQTLLNVFSYSDTFMEVIREHVDPVGHMLEQFNRNTGYMQGAEDLTWSYSSFYNSAAWRKKAKEGLEELIFSEAYDL